MKLLKICSIFTLCFSCNFMATDKNLDYTYNNNSYNQSNSNDLKYHNIYDHDNGMVLGQIPLPKGWNYNAQKNAPITVTGPNNIKVNKTETQHYAYSNDAFTLQSFRQMNNPNVQTSPVYSLEQILHNHIISSAQSQGYQLINSYNLPEILLFWQRYKSGMLKTGSKTHYNVMGTDWQDNNGNKSCIVLIQSIITKDNLISWTLQSTELEAPKTHFNDAKKSFLYALANTQINMEWQLMKNNELLRNIRQNEAFWANATRESQIAHNQRMRAIESRGNATRSIGNTYSDILDINHAGYLKRDNMNSSGHTKSVDMIGERTTISSMATGERYNVQDGSKYYWVNSNAQYFGTNNSFYDPRTDNRVNNEQWTQFEIEN